MVFDLVGIVAHVGAVGREGQLEQRPGETATGLDERKKAARGEVHALQRALHEQDDLTDQPMVGVREQCLVDRDHAGRIPFSANDHCPDERLVNTQMQQRRVELAKRAQRPELVARLQYLFRASSAAPSPAPGRSA